MWMVQIAFAVVACMTCSIKTKNMNVSFDAYGADTVCCGGFYELQHQDWAREWQFLSLGLHSSHE